jgi:hypothetical protein
MARIPPLPESWLEPKSSDRTVAESAHNISRGRIAAFRSLIQAVEPEVLLEKDAVESEALDGRVDY